VYSATKAALENWASALRLEVAKFGITVTSFQPGNRWQRNLGLSSEFRENAHLHSNKPLFFAGNFPTQSRLFSGQRQVYEEMKRSMSPEEKDFYGKYFDEFHQGLINFFDSSKPGFELRDDNGIQGCFLEILEDDMTLIPVVSRNPLLLRLMHFLFRHLPIRASDWLKIRLLKPPVWTPKEYP
jgi:hypothetical protein